MDINENTLGGSDRKRGRVALDWIKKHWILVGLGIFGGLLVSFSLGIGLQLKAVYGQAQELKPYFFEIKSAAGQKNLSELKVKIEETEYELGEFKRRYQNLFLIKNAPYLRKYYQDGEHGLTALEEGLEAGKIVVSAVEPYQDFLGLEETTDGSEIAEAEKTAEDRIDFLVEGLVSIKPELEKISQKLNSISEQLNEINPDDYPENFRGIEIKPQLVSAKQKVKDINLLIGQGGPLIEKADWLMGVDEPRSYLMIFQNDGELRPTGGFWTAYGILEVDDGEVAPKISEDIYALDNRFNSRIEPPQPIKDYHKNVYYWHLRDINLSPNFKESVETFSKYYKDLPGAVDFDGVFAIDTRVLVDLVDALGGIGVPGWGNFTSEPDDRCWGCPQVIYKLEDYADKPASTTRADRKAFLSPMMHSIIANAMASPKDKVAELAQVVFKNFNEKHLLVYFPDPELQQAVEKLNIGGTLNDAADNNDYFHLNDANFAGAKSNLFIEQSVEQNYKVENNKIIKEVTVVYKNTAPASNCNLEAGELCLNGLYRNWMRFYVPEGSKLIEMKGSEVEPKTYSELGKTVFEGFYGDKYPLHPKGSTRVSLTYELPFKPTNNLPVLFVKQPGTAEPEYKVSVNGNPAEEFNLTSDKEIILSL
jgi:hypothetical protein